MVKTNRRVGALSRAIGMCETEHVMYIDVIKKCAKREQNQYVGEISQEISVRETLRVMCVDENIEMEDSNIHTC